MPKNIVICSDGTGNRGGKTRGTNVWRIFNAVDRHNGPTRQITFYDDGVGTQDWRWVRLLAGAFGWGLSRNIREAYAFLAMNYEPGDRIYLFGFSRGAYTVRSLAGMIGRCGLISREALIKAGRRRRVLKRLVIAYRSDECRRKKVLCKVRRALKENDTCFHQGPIPIHFIGVWDTVAAVGMPFRGMTKCLDSVMRMFFRRHLWVFHDRKLGCHVHYACQALALDDERRTFHPLVWKHESHRPDEEGADCSAKGRAHACKKQIVEQVWFAGVHANVGGGYPKDAMALVSLDWMMGKAGACGLKFLKGVRANHRRSADVHGRLYNSRAGLRAVYRYAPRNIYEHYDKKGVEEKQKYLPAIHGSVFERIKRGTDFYAPKVIRKNAYRKAWTDSGPYAKPQQAGGAADGSQ